MSLKPNTPILKKRRNIVDEYKKQQPIALKTDRQYHSQNQNKKIPNSFVVEYLGHINRPVSKQKPNVELYNIDKNTNQLNQTTATNNNGARKQQQQQQYQHQHQQQQYQHQHQQHQQRLISPNNHGLLSKQINRTSNTSYTKLDYTNSEFKITTKPIIFSQQQQKEKALLDLPNNKEVIKQYRRGYMDTPKARSVYEKKLENNIIKSSLFLTHILKNKNNGQIQHRGFNYNNSINYIPLTTSQKVYLGL